MTLFDTLPIVASVSGGKDSTALCLWLLEQGIEFKAVHMDTGWEHPTTDEYLRETLPRHIGPIEWLEPERRMVELIRHKGMFPGRINRFCTQYLKLFPIQEYFDKHFSTGTVLNAVGIRADESKARARLTEFENIEWCSQWRPLLNWTVDDVVAIHRRHDCPPNPLYLKSGITRVGCWPCIFARKKEIQLVADTTPERIEVIRELEVHVEKSIKARYAARGTSLEEKGHRVPTFFSFRNEWNPIDEVVEWAKTSRGGRQFELFYEHDRSGCMRWGLCDAG